MQDINIPLSKGTKAFEVFLPFKIISINDYKDKAKMIRHPKTGKMVRVNKYYKTYRENVFKHVGECIGKPPAGYDLSRFSFVVITSIRHKFLDQDNADGGCKAILDGLNQNGWFLDDTTEHVQFRYYNKKLPKTYHGTVVTLIQLESPLTDQWHTDDQCKELIGIKKHSKVSGDASTLFENC